MKKETLFRGVPNFHITIISNGNDPVKKIKILYRPLLSKMNITINVKRHEQQEFIAMNVLATREKETKDC